MLSEALSPAANAGSSQDHRVAPRIRVKWHADAYIDGQIVHQGFLKDISLSGTDIFLNANLQQVKSIRMRIYVPPLNKKESPHSMDVSGKVVYSAYDSSEFLFHTGVKFVTFSSESDHAFLRSRIKLANQAR